MKKNKPSAAKDNIKRIKRAKLPPTKSRFEDSDFRSLLAKASRENYGSDPSRRKR
jgi:hypothetical protein